MPTGTVEDDLRCIFQKEARRAGARVSTGSIALVLEVAPGTGAAMTKTVRLTDQLGFQAASRIPVEAG